MTRAEAAPATTPRAAALAGVLFGLLFGTALIMIRTALPAGAEEGAQWLDVGSHRMKVAAILMPFAGIAFLWFIGVVRDGFGRVEDKFFSSVFIGAGLCFWRWSSRRRPSVPDWPPAAGKSRTWPRTRRWAPSGRWS